MKKTHDLNLNLKKKNGCRSFLKGIIIKYLRKT